jgi:cytochrome c oxidase assembly protein subunit 15
MSAWVPLPRCCTSEGASGLSRSREPFPELTATPPWLHWWAVATVCATVILLTLGAVVTTFRVGMADPIWPTYPWHMLLISYQEPRPGFIIEHTHRLAGYIVGCCVIILAIGLWRYHAHCWLGWLGVAALTGVIVQGLLGGFRVRLNALVGTDLALIHGLFAQLVFALLVSLALFTSRSWSAPPLFSPAAGTSRVWRLSLATALLIFVQLIFGAILRHTDSSLGPRGHILIALVVVAAVAWLVKAVFDQRGGEKSLTVSVGLLAALVAVQVSLGVEALLFRFTALGLPDLHIASIPEAIIRTAHFVLGSLIFAAIVAVSLWSRRGLAVAVRLPVASRGRLEGAA